MDTSHSQHDRECLIPGSVRPIVIQSILKIVDELFADNKAQRAARGIARLVLRHRFVLRDNVIGDNVTGVKAGSE